MISAAMLVTITTMTILVQGGFGFVVTTSSKGRYNGSSNNIASRRPRSLSPSFISTSVLYSVGSDSKHNLKHQQQATRSSSSSFRSSSTPTIASLAAAVVTMAATVSSFVPGPSSLIDTAFAVAVVDDDVNVVTTTTTPVSSSSPQSSSPSIAKCAVGGGKLAAAPACVSTSNVKQLDMYSPPWTYPPSMTVDEALARLRGAIIDDDELNSIVSVDRLGDGEKKEEGSSSNKYVVVNVDSKRSKLGEMMYRMEFVINDVDKVVTYRSSAPRDSTGPDFGLQRRRLNEIRDRSNGAFVPMGASLNSADTKTSSEQGFGLLGQLKSFYGLQSGSGFEDVLSQ